MWPLSELSSLLFQMLFCVGDFFGSSDTDWLQYTSGASKGLDIFILYSHILYVLMKRKVMNL